MFNPVSLVARTTVLEQGLEGLGKILNAATERMELIPGTIVGVNACLYGCPLDRHCILAREGLETSKTS